MATVPAAARTVAVLRHLAAHSRPVPAAAVARAVGLPRSSTYHLLSTLAESRFVTHLPDQRAWALGPAAFELGQAYVHQRPLARLARPILHRLAHDTGIATHLAVLDGRDVVYVVTEQPPQTMPLVVEVGVRLPAHLTASGRALLAAGPVEQVHASFPDRASLALRTSIGPGSTREFRRLVAQTRLTGVGHEDGEIASHLASVAAVARDHAGRPEAAVTLTFVAAAHDDEARAGLALAVSEAADLLTARLGGPTELGGPTGT